MNALVMDLKEKLSKIREGGTKTSKNRHAEHGKLLPRERIQLLLDPGAVFLELSR